MRIVAMADTHLYHGELQVPDGDVLIHAGDMGRSGSLEELEAARDFLRGLPHRHKVIVAGNHDWAFMRSPTVARALFSGMSYLQDEAVTLDGVQFYGSPWQPEYGGWAFNLPRSCALAEKWAMIPESTDVLVTHSPPAGIGDRSPYPGRHGCHDLRARVDVVRPQLHVFGHVHQDGGRWIRDGVCYVNATTDECMRAVTVIDYPPKRE